MGAWRIATVRGIPIKIHWSFFILPLFYGLGAGSPAGALRGVVFILLLFACVVLHELGHSLAAQYYGITVKEILLLPLGGLAQMTRMPRQPLQEFVVAIAGPAVNIAIVILLGLVVPSALDLQRLSQQAGASASVDLLRDLAITNLYLAGFNLLPAFPMDGGRVLRAILNAMLPYETATSIASWVGRLFAIGFALLGLATGNWILAAIGIFIFAGAGAENTMVQQQAIWERFVAADIARPATSLHPLDLLGQIEPQVRFSAQPIYPVIDGPRLEGMVSRDKILAAAQALGPGTPVQAITDRARYVAADMPLDQLYQVMMTKQLPGLLVIDNHKLLGVVGIEDVVEALKSKQSP
ncbi:MAG: site-2 protease family protein [Chloroflexi bacterium]|nr:site-2 protease family protein [Chloroflexota bacterium]